MAPTAHRCSLTGVQPVYTPTPADQLSSTDFVSHWRRGFQLHVLRESRDDMEFELIGVDAAIANALRRILLAEVPTMAIEEVHIQQNSSIVQDEILALRLGLTPLNLDPRLFVFTGACEPHFFSLFFFLSFFSAPPTEEPFTFLPDAHAHWGITNIRLVFLRVLLC